MFFLSTNRLDFPNPALTDEDGILAVGGDLSPQRLLLAYSWGIFPWFNDDEPILWWCPDPRFVLFPAELKIPKSMRPLMRSARFRVTFDECFEAVTRACGAQPRPDQDGTWISEEMVAAYVRLHELGFAHSVEVWEGETLVGGLYGVALGKFFFGESMFARVSNASKVGFFTLVEKLLRNGYQLIDCQQQTRHLGSLGARAISRNEFLAFLVKNRQLPTQNWAQHL